MSGGAGIMSMQSASIAIFAWLTSLELGEGEGAQG